MCYCERNACKDGERRLFWRNNDQNIPRGITLKHAIAVPGRRKNCAAWLERKSPDCVGGINGSKGVGGGGDYI